MSVLCMDERVCKAFTGRLKSLTSLAEKVKQLYNPQTSDG